MGNLGPPYNRRATDLLPKREDGPDLTPFEAANAAGFAKFKNSMVRGLNRQSRELVKLNARMDKNDLNGSADALRDLGKSADTLRELAEQAGPLLALAKAAAVLLQPEVVHVLSALSQEQRGAMLVELLDDATSRHVAVTYIKKLLRPYRPIGMFLWAGILAIASGIGFAIAHLFSHIFG